MIEGAAGVSTDPSSLDGQQMGAGSDLGTGCFADRGPVDDMEQPGDRFV